MGHIMTTAPPAGVPKAGGLPLSLAHFSLSTSRHAPQQQQHDPQAPQSGGYKQSPPSHPLRAQPMIHPLWAAAHAGMPQSHHPLPHLTAPPRPTTTTHTRNAHLAHHRFEACMARHRSLPRERRVKAVAVVGQPSTRRSSLAAASQTALPPDTAKQREARSCLHTTTPMQLHKVGCAATTHSHITHRVRTCRMAHQACRHMCASRDKLAVPPAKPTKKSKMNDASTGSCALQCIPS